MKWKVKLKESVIEDLRWFGKRLGRILLREAETRLSADPLVISKNIKMLRPNPFAERELRLFGKYRVLFNPDQVAREVTIVVVGEKRGASLFVQGEEFRQHHESDLAE